MRLKTIALHGFLGTFLVLLLASTLLAQDALKDVKELYAAAAYEDALSAVAKLEGGRPNLEAEEYRVYCLVALGRPDEAEQAVEMVLMANPEHQLDAAQASPRIQGLFTQVRRRVGPALVKRTYQQGRAAMEKKDKEEAVARFEAMLRLAESPDIKVDATVAELKELGSGFLELSRTMPSKPAAPVEAASISPPRSHVIVPPTAIQQRLPAWVPNIGNRNAQFRGAVKVQISAEGKVVGAELVKSVHPAYDQLLLRAARGWLYDPARKDGVAIPIDKTIEITFTPPGRQNAGADKSLP